MRDVELVGASSPARSGGRAVYFAMLGWLVWLCYLVPVIASLLARHPTPLQLVASLLGATAFVAIYVWTAWQGARRVIGVTASPALQTALQLWLPLVAMLTLSIILTAANGVTWGALFIYTCAAAAGRLPMRQAAALVAGVAALTALYGWWQHLPVAETVGNVFTLGLASVTTMALLWSVTSSRSLRGEREERARYAAVAEERLRIARDLHDLLGHTLSLIALKSELAGRLVATASERAAGEIADVERVARRALHEVREAVAGYRQPTLASELHGAQDVLAAGMVYHTEGDDAVMSILPAPIDAVLAWTIREGITNVVRHSRARQCDVWVTRAGGEVCVEVRDDGPGPLAADASSAPHAPDAPNTAEAPAAARPGNGLRGLAERVEAQGGRIEVGACAEGGFRLAVMLPLAYGLVVGQTPALDVAAITPTSTAVSRHASASHQVDERAVSESKAQP
jgi:two-component system, NarL family, sensor histidine kinase DesK